ncbi:MAG: hypothetical protein ABUT20_15360 [Bacteroidota bacterium]
MKTNDFIDESILLEELKKKDVRAFAKLYNDYSGDLLVLAFSLLNDAPQAIQNVDELFINLWEGNKFENITPPIHNYLYNEIRKVCKITALSAA